MKNKMSHAEKEILCCIIILSAVKMNDLCVPDIKAFFVFSVIDDTTKEIVYRDFVDISVAVATPKVSQAYYNAMCYLPSSERQAVQCYDFSHRVWWFL